nr:stealth conserved region 3 domain-containing protein [Nocardioides perillae]
MLGEPAVDWLRAELRAACPETLVVPNLLPAGHRPRARLDGGPDGGLVVAAGRLDAEKQFHHLVRAFGRVADRLPDWRVRILGDGALREELLAVARKLGLHDRVELPGTTSDMASEWARADVAVCSSLREGLPLVAQEAMAAGVPVVAYDCPLAVRDIVRDDVNGVLVPAGAEPALARAVLDLATDPERRRRLGDGALATAAEYDPDVVAATWDDVLGRAVARRRGRVPRGSEGEGGRGGSRATLVDPPTPAGVTGQETTPAEARGAVVAAVARIAAATSSDWFVVPAPFPAPPRVVVPHARRRAFLDALAGADLPPWLSAVDPPDHRWLERRGAPAELVAAVRHGATARLLLEPWQRRAGRRTLLAEGTAVHVEFWPEDETGTWHAPVPNGWVTTARPEHATATVEVAGVEVPTLPLLLGRTVDDVDVPVDVVFTWVDGSDPAWDERRRRRLAELGEPPGDPRSRGRARYADRGELRYALRSLHLFAPWVRQVHLVTDGQRPDWLADHPRVRVVDHREVLPAEVLPTFNSHAIETALHRVPGLSEHFLYFNDDVVLGRPLGPSAFFDGTGRAAVFRAAVPVGDDESAPERPHLAAALTNRKLLQEALGVTLRDQVAHSPYAHRVSVLREVEERFGDALRRTAASPFRSPSDVSLLSSLAQHYGLATGAAYWGEHAFRYVDLGNGAVRRTLDGLLRTRGLDSVCLGDNDRSGLPPDEVAALLADFLEQWVPLPAPWER